MQKQNNTPEYIKYIENGGYLAATNIIQAVAWLEACRDTRVIRTYCKCRWQITPNVLCEWYVLDDGKQAGHSLCITDDSGSFITTVYL